MFKTFANTIDGAVAQPAMVQPATSFAAANNPVAAAAAYVEQAGRNRQAIAEQTADIGRQYAADIKQTGDNSNNVDMGFRAQSFQIAQPQIQAGPMPVMASADAAHQAEERSYFSPVYTDAFGDRWNAMDGYKIAPVSYQPAAATRPQPFMLSADADIAADQAGEKRLAELRDQMQSKAKLADMNFADQQDGAGFLAKQGIDKTFDPNKGMKDGPAPPTIVGPMGGPGFGFG